MRLLFSLSVLSALAAPAHADELEVGFTSEALAFVSDTVGATTLDPVAFTPGLRVGWSPIDRVTFLVGWRDLIGVTRDDSGYSLETSGDAILLGTRYMLGLHPVFDLGFEAELEALHCQLDLEIGGTRGSTSAWAFGLIPKVVGQWRVDMEVIDFDFRLFAGFAARTSHRADALRLRSEAPARQVAPVDLGSVNLSGFVFGANLALVF